MFLTFFEDLIMEPVSSYVLSKGAAVCAAKAGAAAKACMAKFSTAAKSASAKGSSKAATSKAGAAASRSDCGTCGTISEIASP